MPVYDCTFKYLDVYFYIFIMWTNIELQLKFELSQQKFICEHRSDEKFVTSTFQVLDLT